MLVAGLETLNDIGDPELSADGCELFLDTEADSDSDLYVSEVVP